MRRGELEAILADIHLPEISRPGIKAAQPTAMPGAQVVDGEALLRIHFVQQGQRQRFQRFGFGLLDVAHAGDARQVCQHAAARARLVGAFAGAIGSVAVTGHVPAHRTPCTSQRPPFFGPM